MKFQVRKVSQCRYALRIEVEPAALERRTGEFFERLRKTVTLKGYREGRAPVELVRARFKTEAEEEVVRAAVGDALEEGIRRSRMDPIGRPEIRDLQTRNGGTLAFTAEFEVAPRFNLRTYKGIRVRRRPAGVAEQEIDKSLEALRESHAVLEPAAIVRPVIEGDVVRCDIERFKDGRYEIERRDVLFAVERGRLPEAWFEKLVGALPGDARDVAAEMSAEERAAGLVGWRPGVRVTVREIKIKKLPELDAAFAQSLGKPAVEELRAAVKDELGRGRAREADEQALEEIYENLLESHDFELPDSFVERQKKRLAEHAAEASPQGSAPAGEIAHAAARQVKLLFILDKIGREENITADDAEVSEGVRRLASEMNRPEEEIRDRIGADIRENLRQIKIRRFLLANASIEGGEK